MANVLRPDYSFILIHIQHTVLTLKKGVLLYAMQPLYTVLGLSSRNSALKLPSHTEINVHNRYIHHYINILQVQMSPTPFHSFLSSPLHPDSKLLSPWLCHILNRFISTYCMCHFSPWFVRLPWHSHNGGSRQKVGGPYFGGVLSVGLTRHIAQ